MIHTHQSPARLFQVQGYDGGEIFHLAPRITFFVSPTYLLLSFIQKYSAGMWASEVTPTHLACTTCRITDLHVGYWILIWNVSEQHGNVYLRDREAWKDSEKTERQNTFFFSDHQVCTLNSGNGIMRKDYQNISIVEEIDLCIISWT
jgi:hypothetical protein